MQGIHGLVPLAFDGPGPPRADRERIDGLHLRGIERGWRVEVVEEHVESVMAPEDLVADEECGDTERALRYRPLGVVVQMLFDRRAAQGGVGGLDSELFDT